MSQVQIHFHIQIIDYLSFLILVHINGPSHLFFHNQPNALKVLHVVFYVF